VFATLDTIRNREQDKRYPTGAARALSKVHDRVPKAAPSALD
jgi:putative transcriptional regulator